MAEPKADALVQSVQKLIAEKVAVAAREKRLVARLGAVLVKIGYQVVPLEAGNRARPTRRRGRRRRDGRMSSTARRAVSRRMKAYWAKRRGRAAKAKATRRRRGRAKQAAS